jgi:hypothetical protein
LKPEQRAAALEFRRAKMGSASRSSWKAKGIRRVVGERGGRATDPPFGLLYRNRIKTAIEAVAACR